ncbi:MAG: GNAT family N-acetyltransferase [Melioribacteraceae bacterium]|nr:GNAT family N-acetyltransferase [Melioribacteraceae bacterium]
MSNNRIIENYRDDENLRNEFHNFISKVFPSISFKVWYSKGFWSDKHIPFSIIESGEIISHVSASLMNILIDGKKYKAVQIGAVGTLPDYRNKGLSRYLMNYVLDKFKDKTDFFFLYANETVLDFYPKFGFKNISEFKFIAESNIPKPRYSARKLNIKLDSDYQKLIELINHRRLLTKRFGAEDYGFITMWYIFNLYSDNLYYVEEEDVIIIKKEKDETLHILDVIFKKPFEFDSILEKIIESESIKSINYYFTPDQINYRYDNAVKENTELFVLGNIELGNSPFRFPATAVT